MIRNSHIKAALQSALILAVLQTLFIQCAFALEVPRLAGRVNDYAGMLSPAAEQKLERMLSEFEQRESTQIVVLTIPSLDGEALEDFSMRVAEKWKIGQRGLDNGAILLVAKAERKVRIEVGYGLEGRLTDLHSARIIRGIIVPEFKAGRYDNGVIRAVEAMIAAVRGEFKAEDKDSGGRISSRDIEDAIPIMVLFIFIVFAFGRINRILGTAAGGFFMPFLGHTAFSLGFLGILALIAMGLAAGFIISLFASLVRGITGQSRGFRGGFGGYSGGFGAGGGFSSGGFSGGGGGFGGGGSSGSW